MNFTLFATVQYVLTCDNNCVASNVTMSVSVTSVISEWEGGAHEGTRVESNHVLLHSTGLVTNITW